MRIPFLDRTRDFRAARVTRDIVPLRPAARARAGTRVVFVSDLHVSRDFSSDALRTLARQVDALGPDLVALGGDYGESRDWIVECLSVFAALKPRLGCVGVLGNNDREFFRGALDALFQSAGNLGVRLLVNERVRFAGIDVAGLDEMQNGAPEFRDYFAGGDESDFRLLLSHYPHALPAALRETRVKPDYALCGHTHGGQVSLFGLTPYSFGFEKRHGHTPLVSGRGAVCGVPVRVSNGVGTSRAPLRVCRPPQIHLLTLS